MTAAIVCLLSLHISFMYSLHLHMCSIEKQIFPIQSLCVSGEEAEGGAAQQPVSNAQQGAQGLIGALVQPQLMGNIDPTSHAVGSCRK